MSPIPIDAREMMSGLTVSVGVRLAGLWRVRLGCWLIRLGAGIAGCNLEIKAPGVISHAGPMTPGQASRLRAEWEGLHRGERTPVRFEG